MAIPMRLKEERTIDSGCASPEQIENRLYRWAARHGFTSDKADFSDQWIFRRGSHWHALFTFDIRKIPTVVEIEIDSSEAGPPPAGPAQVGASTAITDKPPLAERSLPPSTLWVTCRMQCGSWLQFSTPGDQKRLAEQMDLLEACIKG